jgi:NADH-quinone oxidoreductase subunit F
MHFYAHESCGQCTPCREGTGWLYKMSKHILKGGASRLDRDRIFSIADHMRGKTICVLSDAAADPARAIITKFAHEFEPYFKG